MTNYPLACSSWDQKELNAIKTVTKSDMFTMGKHVKHFEDEFAKFTGSNYCIMVNSGSSANLLAVAALFYRKENPLRAGDEVIVPAVSWSTTYYPLHQYGLKLKFVDIDSETLNYDLEALSDAVSDNTKMIMVVNLLGNPNDFESIDTIINGRNIVLFEDNCESMGATYNNRQAGSFGIMGTYSSFFSHHISTMEGGMIVTDDEELYHILLSTRSHGWTRGLPKKNKVSKISNDPFYESFRFVLPGYNLRPLEMSGAIGLEQLKKLPSLIKSRRINAKKFKTAIVDIPFITTQKEVSESSWFGFSITINNDAPYSRQEMVKALQQSGIDCRPIVTGNFTRHPVIEYFNYTVHGELKNADHAHDNGLFIGNHHFQIDEQLALLKNTLEGLI